MKRRFAITQIFHHNLFIQFFLTYVGLLLIPLVLGIGVNSALVQQFQASLEENKLAVLRQTRDVIEGTIDDLEWRMFQIAGSPRLSRLITEYRTTGVQDSLLTRELVASLNTYTLYSSNLKSTFYLYLQEPPLILTPYSVYRHEDFTEDKTYFLMDGISIEDWHDRIFSRYHRREFYPVRRVTIEDFTSKPMIPYVQSLPVAPISQGTEVTGAIVYLLGEDEFRSLLGNLNLPPGGWAFIADAQNQILTQEGESPLSEQGGRSLPVFQGREGLLSLSLEGTDYFLIYTTSEYGWKYAAYLPAEPVLQPVYRLQQISLLTLMGSMLISMAVASIISYRRARPLQQLLREIGDVLDSSSPGKTSGIQALGTGVQQLISQSRHLQLQLERQEAVNQGLLVNRLLHGSFRSKNEMQSFLEYLKITITENCFVAMVMSLQGFRTLDTVSMIDEMNRTKVVLKALIHNTFPGRVFLSENQEEQIALILMAEQERGGCYWSGLDDQLEGIQRDFEEIYHGRLVIGIGTPKAEILEIAASFEEAKQALQSWKPGTSRDQIYFTQDLVNPEEYYYPIELEIRLSNAVRAGDEQALEQGLATLCHENFERRKISHTRCLYLYHEVYGTYRKLRDSLSGDLAGASAAIPPEAEISGEPESLETLFQQFRTITRQLSGAKRSHNKELIQGITAYLRDRYTDPGLGLSMVASRFSITESYLSFFFKEQTGENFSNYIESLRIDQAVQLLKTTDAGIHGIAQMVGYNNDKTFRRVFKKLKGLSPSEFRQEYSQRRML